MMAAFKKEKEKIIADIKDKIKWLEDRHLKFGSAKTLNKLNIAHKKIELYEMPKPQRNILYLKQYFATKSP